MGGKFKMMDVLQDKVTGFTGVVLGIATYATGLTNYGLQSKRLDNGKPTELQRFDSSRLKVAEEERIGFKKDVA